MQDDDPSMMDGSGVQEHGAGNMGGGVADPCLDRAPKIIETNL